ncbi:MAG: DUF5995 family protein [Acidobacteriota bacterium]|nr:DUF5995 family protein [Acidobacteriota bacterium]
MSAARTIDEVVARLDEQVARSRREQDRLGYFAALYRGVTARVREGIGAGRFEDGGRMEHLDVTFANRYLDALERYRRGEPTSRCWVAAFAAARSPFPIVLQHLLLGINAHINLDLGVAAAEAAPGDRLGPMRKDFDAINDILCAMLDEVQDRLARVSAWMTVLDRAGCRTDEEVMNFSINKARAQAWAAAERLARLDGADDRRREIEALDLHAALRARLIRHPGLTFSAANLVVRLSERGDVAQIINALA